ncbi:hypothetical protein BpHYR1_015496 [Brachionus plicatilis]|uniref:Uncharacterized protein n=1 Tax=Brachionus plicatilis TaxID=10195 RepID=A0A3M7PH09_BRAPC|nr:hypothetical protein BpHYR1_015496 [Brachionus plicatilis]
MNAFRPQNQKNVFDQTSQCQSIKKRVKNNQSNSCRLLYLRIQSWIFFNQIKEIGSTEDVSVAAVYRTCFKHRIQIILFFDQVIIITYLLILLNVKVLKKERKIINNMVLFGITRIDHRRLIASLVIRKHIVSGDHRSIHNTKSGMVWITVLINIHVICTEELSKGRGMVEEKKCTMIKTEIRDIKN